MDTPATVQVPTELILLIFPHCLNKNQHFTRRKEHNCGASSINTNPFPGTQHLQLANQAHSNYSLVRCAADLNELCLCHICWHLLCIFHKVNACCTPGSGSGTAFEKVLQTLCFPIPRPCLLSRPYHLRCIYTANSTCH